MIIFPYDHDRIMENKAGSEPITVAQLQYIINLQLNKNYEDVLNSIPDWSGNADYDLQKLSKGQAMYIIKCLKGEIKPIKITNHIKNMIMSAVERGEFDE
jgi:hypothetical protein